MKTRLIVTLGPTPCKACKRPVVWGRKPTRGSQWCWRDLDTDYVHTCR